MLLLMNRLKLFAIHLTIGQKLLGRMYVFDIGSKNLNVLL